MEAKPDTPPAEASGAAAESNALKDRGNEEFAKGHYSQAMDFYTRALALTPESAILLSNRAACALKCESYGTAIADAGRAIEIDASYIKAWYRRGSAYMALGKTAQARADFFHVCKLKPQDKDARAKLEECDRVIRQKKFESAIATEVSKPPSERLDPSALAVEDSYTGPRLPAVPAPGQAASAEECAADETRVNEHGISLKFVKDLMECFKGQKLLHKRYAQEILIRLKRRILAQMPSLFHADLPKGDGAVFNVCGDTHGHFYDTLNIFESVAGMPSPTNCYLFNGDFVDRGSFGVENVLTLFAFRLLYPAHFHLTRGNHETKNMNVMYGFTGEVKHKYDASTMDLFGEVFCALPLAGVVGNKVFVVHGGLFQSDGVKLSDIARVPRFREPPEDGLMSDLLWSDPQPFPGRGPSKRGVGQSFGPDITAAFLKDNNLEMVIRSHEVMDEGYQVIHDGKLVTVFSAPNYCDSMNNKGGVVRLDSSGKPTYVSFSSVPHPPVKPMAYAAGMSSFFGL